MDSNEYKKKCEWLAGFYAEAARTGREIQTDYYDNENSTVWKNHPHGPSLQSTENHWRLKPEPQKAWVVWANDWPCIVMTEQAAKNQARMSGGTIQEITRPEPQ